AYDLLVSGGLQPSDDQAFRAMLTSLVDAQDLCPHHHCNNHNMMSLAARMSIAAALGDRQFIHDSLYGTKRSGQWRYGVVHTLRHDFLSDGMNWEGTLGYHHLVLLLICEFFTIMNNLGVDLWKRSWPSTVQDDGFDEHRGWGPKGAKTLPSAFDAMIFQGFAN